MAMPRSAHHGIDLHLWLSPLHPLEGNNAMAQVLNQQ